jgi:hypothetical protein
MEEPTLYNWRTDARCRPDRLAELDVDPDLFFPYQENLAVVQYVRSVFCNLCPVVADCLADGIEQGASGIWGGLSTAERRAMSRKRTRVKCPVCLAVAPVRVEGAQVCASCGASWEGDRPALERAS